MNHYVSIYVPRMKSQYTFQDVFHIVQNTFHIQLGLNAYAYDIDFVCVNPSRTFFSNLKPNDKFKAAFIYMNIVCNQKHPSLNKIINGIAHKIEISDNEFWWILKNSNPIERTCLNIHQIVHLSQFLEQSVLKQQNCIKQLQENMGKLIDHITNKTPLTNDDMDKMKENLICPMDLDCYEYVDDLKIEDLKLDENK